MQLIKNVKKPYQREEEWGKFAYLLCSGTLQALIWLQSVPREDHTVRVVSLVKGQGTKDNGKKNPDTHERGAHVKSVRN